MAEERKVFRDNEVAANNAAAKVMFVSFFIYTLIFLMNVVGFFIVPHGVMSIAYILGSAFLLIPYILVKRFKNHKWYVKYFFVFSAALFVASANAMLSFHIVILFCMPIFVASLYFNKKVIRFSVIITIVATIISQLLYYHLDYVSDLNFFTFKKFIMFAIVPRSMGIMYAGWLANKTCTRAYYILGDLVSAEEKNLLMGKNEKIKNKAAKVSSVLINDVDELQNTSINLSSVSEHIAKEADVVLNNTAENVKNINEVNKNFKEIVDNIVSLDKKTSDITVLSKMVNDLTKDNQDMINLATAQMRDVNDSADRCKIKIEGLGKHSNEIINIISLISEISDQTQLLSLNASIEAARAGEQGKGFAVVAEEINKLSNQTKSALDNIGKVINEVVKDTNEAVFAVEQSAKKTKEGLKSITEAKSASDEITRSNGVMSSDIGEIYNIAKVIAKNSMDIENYLGSIKQSVKENYSMMEQVSSATDSNTVSSQVLVKIVDSIKGVANELNEIVSE